MQVQTIGSKMQEYVQDFREQLLKGDMASVPALIENSGTFFRELMQELPRGAFPCQEVEIFASCVDRFGAACGQRDLDAAAATLAEMEEITETVRKKCGEKLA